MVETSDLGDRIDAGRAEHLHVVELSEFTAVVGCGELLEFVDGLATEIAAVDQKENTLGTRMLNQAVARGGCGCRFCPSGLPSG
jgi:hypothetical protein